MHVKPCMGERQRSKFSSLNNTSLIIALLGVIGAVIVANVEVCFHFITIIYLRSKKFIQQNTEKKDKIWLTRFTNLLIGDFLETSRQFWLKIRVQKPSLAKIQRLIQNIGPENRTPTPRSQYWPLTHSVMVSFILEANDHLYLHNTGAILVVVMSIAYGWIHTYLSFTSPIVHWIKFARTAICLFCTAAFISGEWVGSVISVIFNLTATCG